METYFRINLQNTKNSILKVNDENNIHKRKYDFKIRIDYECRSKRYLKNISVQKTFYLFFLSFHSNFKPIVWDN